MTENPKSGAATGLPGPQEVKHMLLLEPVQTMTEAEWLDYCMATIASHNTATNEALKILEKCEGEEPEPGDEWFELYAFMRWVADLLDMRITTMVEHFRWGFRREKSKMKGARKLDDLLDELAEPMPPLWRQIAQLRGQTDALLAVQMGAFFEFYDDDAEVVAEICNVALTWRSMGQGGQNRRTAGLPAPSTLPGHDDSGVVFLGDASPYYRALLEAGRSVAFAVVTGQTGGWVDRQIVATLTPDALAASSRSSGGAEGA